MPRRSLDGSDRQINADANAGATGQGSERIPGPATQINDDRRLREIQERRAAGNRIDQRAANARGEQGRARLDRGACISCLC